MRLTFSKGGLAAFQVIVVSFSTCSIGLTKVLRRSWRLAASTAR